MTTAVSAYPFEEQGRRARPRWTQWIERNVWALGDQILISAANFITMVLAARSMQPAAFGAFTLVYSALLLANVLQSTLVTQAHNVLGATRAGIGYNIYTTTTAVGQLIFIAAEALIAAAVAGWAYLHASPQAALLVALVPAIVGWQLQEFVRRVLYTEGRIAAAFVNDVISYAGQTIWVVMIWHTHTLTGPNALYALAWTSIAASLLGVWQLRGSLCRKIDFAALVENWHFGKWLAGAEIVGWCSSLHMYLYLAAIFIGTAATAELKAAQLIFGPTRMLAFFLGNVLPIRFTRALIRGGDPELHAGVQKATSLVVPLLGSYCLLAAIFARPLLKMVYGDSYAGDPTVLQLYALCAFLNYMQMVIAAALAAKRLTQKIFISSVYGGLVALSLSWVLIKTMGNDGAIVCMILTAVIVSVLYWRSYRRSLMPIAICNNPQESELPV